jgi:hypothetical protein
MEETRKELVRLGKNLEDLVLKISVKAKEFRRYPHYEAGDRFDRAAIYVNAAAVKLHKARQEMS